MDAKAHNKEWLSAAACAARTGLTVRALRVYEREDLLNPTRSANGWRRYGPSDLERLNTIVILKGLGLTLAEIREVMSDRSPSLLRMLDLQASTWKAKITAAQHALQCVEAARHRLQSRQDLSIEDLCSLIKTLDESRSIGMQNATSLMRDIINEIITPEEERAWITWWTKHPKDATAAKAFNEEQTVLFLEVQALTDRGVHPASPAAQSLIEEHDAILLRHGVWERTVRLLEWNSVVTSKFYSLGAEARSRQAKHPSDSSALATLTQSAADFFAAARKASSRAPIVKAVLNDADTLLDAQVDPAETDADDVVFRWRQVCSEHSLGDPYDVAQCAPFLDRVNRVNPAELNDAAWEFLASAVRARHGDNTPQVPARSP
jgi:MerR family transcriptional regulator, thiopeptide resistance regulator